MPSLSKAYAQRAKEVGLPEGGEFALIPDGLYLTVPDELTVLPSKDPADKAKFGQWQVRFRIVEDATDAGTGDEFAGKNLMNWYSLSDKDYPIQLMNEFHVACGHKVGDNTDEFIGKCQVVVDVGHEVARFGKRKDQTVNTILSVMDPAGFYETAPEAAKGEEPF